MVRILPAEDVRSVLDLEDVLDVVEGAFDKQVAGAVERPERPHYPVGAGLDEADPDRAYGTGLVMPAYIHGSEYFATKLVSVHDDNPSRGLPTIHAQIVVSDAETGAPVSIMDGAHVTSARTSAIGGLAARHLTDGPIRVGVIGAGTQARWQVRAIAAGGEVSDVRMFDLDDEALADAVAELTEEYEFPIEAADDAEAAVTDADIVVTATTSPQPVFEASALDPDAVVVAIGAYTPEMQEIAPETFDRAAKIFADVPEEVAEIGDIQGSNLEKDDLVPLGTLYAGNADVPEGIIVVESVGTAVMDAAAAEYVYEASLSADLGIDVTL